MNQLKIKLNELNLDVLLKYLDEIHILSDTDEYESHKDLPKDSLIVYEYTSNVRLIAEELILNNAASGIEGSKEKVIVSPSLSQESFTAPNTATEFS